MKNKTVWIIGAIVLATVADACLKLAAQDTGSKFDVQVQGDVIYKHVEGQGPGPLFLEQMAPGEPADFTFSFVSSGMSFGDGVVKGAPFSADTANETIQTLSDGNRIIRKSSGKLYRDTEGRTRREQTLGTLGFWVPADEPQQLIFVNDPVAGVNYVLETNNKIARKLPSLPSHISESKGIMNAAIPAGESKGGFGTVSAETMKVMPFPGETKTEALGKQVIEGIEADGTRNTMTIPAGKIGNELPIQVVSERWFSQELKMVIRSENNDPRFGKSVYQLTNISRDEPAHSFFEVPSDYTVKDEPRVLIRKTVSHNTGGNN
ncbi:MAG TPA: hypothetical protein VMW38_11515 [Terriglobia bacterium]|nr:hypothetical protein [Terriglobia bacterium]